MKNEATFFRQDTTTKEDIEELIKNNAFTFCGTHDNNECVLYYANWILERTKFVLDVGTYIITYGETINKFYTFSNGKKYPDDMVFLSFLPDEMDNPDDVFLDSRDGLDMHWFDEIIDEWNINDIIEEHYYK